MNRAAELSQTALTVSRVVPASPEEVFRAWTEPAEIEKWWPPEGYTVPGVEVDLRVGGSYRLGLQPPGADPFWATGTYREVDPPRRLVFTWSWEPSDVMNVGETLVTIEFRDQGGETEVLLTHERFPTAHFRDEHQKGWTACLERLERVTA